jgi:quercetin dioxygenase-like cupin family protein
MTKRLITKFDHLKFEPFDNYGVVVPGMSWHKISYSKENHGQGTYVLKMEPGAKSIPHEHTGFEEFLMLDGELTDPDGKIFKKGDFISFEPGSKHSSHFKQHSEVFNNYDWNFRWNGNSGRFRFLQ